MDDSRFPANPFPDTPEEWWANRDTNTCPAQHPFEVVLRGRLFQCGKLYSKDATFRRTVLAILKKMPISEIAKDINAQFLKDLHGRVSYFTALDTLLSAKSVDVSKMGPEGGKFFLAVPKALLPKTWAVVNGHLTTVHEDMASLIEQVEAVRDYFSWPFVNELAETLNTLYAEFVQNTMTFTEEA